MKCRFCGKRIKKNSNVCSKCGKEVTEGIAPDELIDALPELHDEFDNISKMQQKEKIRKEKKEKRARHKVRRIVIAIIVVLAIAGGVLGGMLYHKQKEAERLKQEELLKKSSSIESVIEKTFISGGFTDMLVKDSASAKDVIKAQSEIFSFFNADAEFELSKEIKIGTSTVYRFTQKYNQLPVYGGEMVLMADSEGKVIGLNGVYVPTKGLETTYRLNEGDASAALSEYVNSLEEFAVVSGVNITEIKKVVLNTNNKAYIAYSANVSGYNSSSEYIAYDVFVDGSNGEGICVSVTSSFENGSSVTEDEVEESYIYKMMVANDKFNWNDETLNIAREKILIDDVTSGNSSLYVKSVKDAVDSAYNYFSYAYGYKGLSGDGESFTVFINPNDYVEEDLPTERAMYTNGKLMFFREDLTQGDINYNTVVHEYAHGVMHNIVGFRGTMEFSENSAIAEGMADVFSELAEATVSGSADWIHNDRILYAPDGGYLSYVPATISINTVSDCYNYSTIVSHLAYNISQIVPDVSLQNELWFKSMCFMTKNTDFSELSSIINVIASDMHSEYRLTDEQYQQISETLKSLDGSVYSGIVD